MIEQEETKTEASADVAPPRKALVALWVSRIQEVKTARKKVFEDMRKAMRFAHQGCDDEWLDSGAYRVPILPRYINQAVATLYARNPKTIWSRKQRLMYQLWDGRSDTLQAAMELAQMGDVQARALLDEVLGVRENQKMADRMGQTTSLLWQYFLDEQTNNFKQQLKAAVRRTKIAKVAWVKLGFQRTLEERPEITAQMQDATSKIAQIEASLANAQEDSFDDQSAELEQLRLNVADLERDKVMVVKEGPVLDFPKSDAILVSLDCVHLKSLAGASFVVHEFEMTKEKVKRMYDCDLPESCKWRMNDTRKSQGWTVCIWEIWDRENQQVSVVCEGYDDFLKEPASPEVWMERFYPFFPIVFNEVEHYEEIYPMSDVEQGEHIQREYNRAREALRQHRIAAQPFWVQGGALDEEEKKKLQNRVAHQVITMPTLAAGQNVKELLQPGPTAPVDPNLYETETHFNDLMRVVGYQEAQIGSTSGATATESSIAQQSNSMSQSDNVDDLDEAMSELARAAGQVLLLNMTKEQVIKIVGIGAVWPDTPQSREEAADEIVLSVKAGSTGRPNQAAELANVERAAPYLMQIPGINPRPFVQKYADLLSMDMDDLYTEGLPSLTAINAVMAKSGMGAPSTGNPASDPNMQGANGASNAPAPAATEPGGQPAYSSSMLA